MQIVMRCLGGLILLVWVIGLLPGQRKASQRIGSLMKATIFQGNILPFLLSLGLLVTANWWIIPVGILCFLISRSSPTQTTDFFIMIFPMICGGYYGNYIMVELLGPTSLSHILGVILGIVCMFVAMSVIVGIANPQASMNDKEIQ